MTTVRVNVLVNYGNGTKSWYNQTNVPSNWNAYSLTVYIFQCNVQSTWYGPPLNEHLVTGIGGVSNREHSSWTLWTLCGTAEAWYFSSVGADNIGLMSGTTFAWAYQSDSSLPPVPGAKTTSSC